MFISLDMVHSSNVNQFRWTAIPVMFIDFYRGYSRNVDGVGGGGESIPDMCVSQDSSIYKTQAW